MIIEIGGVSMGTGAPLSPQMFIVVNSMKTLITGSFMPSFLTGQWFNEIHLVMEGYKSPAMHNKNFRSSSQLNKTYNCPFFSLLSFHLIDTNTEIKCSNNKENITGLQVFRCKASCKRRVSVMKDTDSA